MPVVETVANIRRGHFVQGQSIKAICRELRLSRKVVRQVVRSKATEFRYARGPAAAADRAVAGGTRQAAGGQRGEAEPRAADADPGLRGTAQAWRRGRLGCRSALGARMAARSGVDRDGCLCCAELCARRGVPVRLEPRDRADQRHDGDAEGLSREADQPCPAVPRPDAVRAGLSARDAGSTHTSTASTPIPGRSPSAKLPARAGSATTCRPRSRRASLAVSAPAAGVSSGCAATICSMPWRARLHRAGVGPNRGRRPRKPAQRPG